MESDIDTIKALAYQQLERIDRPAQLQKWHDDFLGKKGRINQLLKKIPQLDPAERAATGKLINRLKDELSEKHNQKKAVLEKAVDKPHDEIASPDFVELTAPGITPPLGHLHPISQVREEAERIFNRMGFKVYEAREIDDDYHVFESLNMPPHHPARDIWDTIWTENGLVCTTHTSSMQNRILQQEKPPFRAIIYGRCFRFETLDATHEHTFYQIEGLCVDEDIVLTDLIGTLKEFLNEFYQRDVKLKIQPSFFPFVEPGLEFLIDCAICQGKGETKGVSCSTCKGAGWIELVPAGMIHPNVLKEAGLDPEKYQGFAWGLGLDRLVMIKHGIEDIRHFHRGDLRFLEQF